MRVTLDNREAMFTGIIEAVGSVRTLQRSGSTAALEIGATQVLDGLSPGDSIAVNGVCLTVRKLSSRGFLTELSAETLNRSSLGELKPSSLVNLERPLLPTSRLGGHFVQGHVDGVGKVLAMRKEEEFAVGEFSLPASLRRYVVEKGSIAVDGISLTVAALKNGSFEVALIPHTLQNTNLQSSQPGSSVNLECDVLAKYVESFLNRNPARVAHSPLTVEYLRDKGY